jgi:hypothetical protein
MRSLAFPIVSACESRRQRQDDVETPLPSRSLSTAPARTSTFSRSRPGNCSFASFRHLTGRETCGTIYITFPRGQGNLGPKIRDAGNSRRMPRSPRRSPRPVKEAIELFAAKGAPRRLRKERTERESLSQRREDAKLEHNESLKRRDAAWHRLCKPE